MIRTLLLLIILSMPVLDAVAQDFLSVDGRRIVDASNEPVVLRGIGLDGWMVKEGPLLGTSTVIPSQHEFHELVESLVDDEVANDFYQEWLAHYIQKVDVDQIKAFGYNTIRIPMHYNLFTLPIEEEPIAGENTWLEDGFTLLDNVIGWSRQNGLYVILELKAAPGGQNTDPVRSDYDADKPSLWEDSNNVSKTLALWRRIAQRYADEPVVAGYSILSEPETADANLLTLYRNVGFAIREVDQNHIIFMYANDLGTDFTGLATNWDDKIVATTSKLQTINDQASIQNWLDFRNQNDIPLFVSKIYDNSNSWMRDAINLLEGRNIGWSFAPLKRVEGTSGTYVWTPDSRYQRLLNFIYGNASAPGPTTAKNSILSLARGLLPENITYFKDVNDAIFRQTQTDEAIPFAANTVPGVVFAPNYDLGLPGIAYEDDTVENVLFSNNRNTPWNNGRSYRNDGVDMEPSQDETNSNGFLVGWNKSNEWLQYTLDITENGLYDIDIRYASLINVGVLYLELDGVRITENLEIPTTGSWQGWETFTIKDVVLATTDKVLRLNVQKAATRAGSFNLGSFNFRLTGSSSDISTAAISGESAGESGISILVNKALIDQNLTASDFTLTVNGSPVAVTDASVNGTNNRIIDLSTSASFFWTDEIIVSYAGTGIEANDGTELEPFSNLEIQNNAPVINQLPARIEAEDFVSGTDVRIETTEDGDGGENVGFIDDGDIIEYSIVVTEADIYSFIYRTSSRAGGGAFRMDLVGNGSVTTLHQHTVPETGDWESYQNSTNSGNLPVGEYTLRIVVTDGGFNINWFEVSNITSSESPEDRQMLTAFPNPGKNYFRAQGKFSSPRNASLIVRDMLGRQIWEKDLGRAVEYNELIPTDGFPKGVYLLILQDSNGVMTSTRIIKE